MGSRGLTTNDGIDLWYALNSWFMEQQMDASDKSDHVYANPEQAESDEFPYTPDELAAQAKKEAERQRPARREIKRTGITKNKGKGAAKAKRKRAKLSRRINRERS